MVTEMWARRRRQHRAMLISDGQSSQHMLDTQPIYNGGAIKCTKNIVHEMYDCIFPLQLGQKEEKEDKDDEEEDEEGEGEEEEDNVDRLATVFAVP